MLPDSAEVSLFHETSPFAQSASRRREGQTKTPLKHLLCEQEKKRRNLGKRSRRDNVPDAKGEEFQRGVGNSLRNGSNAVFPTLKSLLICKRSFL